MPPSRTDLRAARVDLAAFARLCARPLTAWQARALQLERRFTVVVAPRQTGKSRSLALLALHWAFRQPGQRVLIVSAGEEAAKRLLAEVRDLAASSPLLSGSVVDESIGLLTLSNGSEVRSVPASERQVRGWTVDLLLVDEAALIDDDLLLSAALPTTAARPDARIVLASSPLGTAGPFYDYALRGDRGSANVATFHWRLSDAEWVTPETVAALREGMSPQRQAAELDGEFVDHAGGDHLLERSWIDAAQARTLPHVFGGVLGADVARFGGDRTMGYANKGGVIRRAFAGRGWATDRTAGRVVAALREQLNSPPEAFAVVVDDTGVGGGTTDALRAAGVPVVAFIGAERARQPARFANRRAERFWWMREAFEQGLVDLDPADGELAAQLAGLRYRFDGRGRLLMESKDAMRARGVPSPDAADACCMTFDVEQWRPPRVLTEGERLAEQWERVRARERRRAAMADVESLTVPADGWDGSLTSDLMGADW